MSSMVSYFLLSLTLASAMQHVSTGHHPRSDNLAEIPTVTYCELIFSPKSYVHKIVRVRATYVVGFEIAALEDDPECRKDVGRMIGVRFDDLYRLVTIKKVLKAFDGLIEVNKNKWGELRKADVIFIGEFQGERESVPYGDKMVVPKYDGIYKYQLVVKQIEKAQKLPHR